MNQHPATGHAPVRHHDPAEARYALTAAGHGALAPTGGTPAPPVVLACTDCDEVYEPTEADLVSPAAGGGS